MHSGCAEGALEVLSSIMEETLGSRGGREVWGRAMEEKTAETAAQKGRDGRRHTHRRRQRQSEKDGGTQRPAEMSSHRAAVPRTPAPAPCAHLVAPESHALCHSQQCWVPPAAEVPLPRPVFPVGLPAGDSGPQGGGTEVEAGMGASPDLAPPGKALGRVCVSHVRVCCSGTGYVYLSAVRVSALVSKCVRLCPCVHLGRRGDCVVSVHKNLPLPSPVAFPGTQGIRDLTHLWSIYWSLESSGETPSKRSPERRGRVFVELTEQDVGSTKPEHLLSARP